ncbi:acetyl-CoA synthetase-like protein [Abortiporus biennis]|nr:acetyl-CoA synthetase-like protein [Abortiporus biennis]
MPFSDYLVTDDLTIILGLVAAGLFLLHNLYKPQSLVHPILLGRQSDVARVRNPGESAHYRNYGTGMLGRFPTRPAKEQQVLLDLVRTDVDAPRTLWSAKITNPQLRQRVQSFGTGLIRTLGLNQESNVLLLLNDEFLISDLALASYGIPSLTLSSLSVLSPVLDEHPPSVIITHSGFLPTLLELIHESSEGENHTIIVVGDFQKPRGITSAKILKWFDIEKEGSAEPISPHKNPSPQDVFTVSFFSDPTTGELRGTALTHENITAGVASTRALLPMSGAISSLDTIISAHPLSTAFGRAVAYTAIYEGTNFATLKSTAFIGADEDTKLDLSDLKSTNAYPIPSPTLLFIKPPHLASLAAAIVDEAKKNFILFSLAWRHKFSGVLEGYLTKQSLWDRLVFDNARVKVLGKGAGTVRAVVVSGGELEAQSLAPTRIALSVPLVNAHIHPAVAGPVLASHPLDLQTFPAVPGSSAASAADNYAFTYLAPVGPPAINVEAKLVGVDDTHVEGGHDPIGALHVRGPPVGKIIHVEEGPSEKEGWIHTGERAKVLTNGTFKVTIQAK